ncbi:MAG: S8 family serine peptidase [Campylobacterales bacterium]|nr:S8 family serine peptidase [Campylobacterales bacterium]
MRTFFLIFISFFVIGCGDSDTKKAEDNLPKNNNTVVKKARDPMFNQQWAMDYDKDFYQENSINENAHINPEDSYDRYTGKGVTIAIIDNGFDSEHPELKGRIVKKINLSEKGDSEDISQNKSETHGTNVSGIIGANVDGKGIQGIAPEANLILIKMNTESYMSKSDELLLFKRAVEEGADIITCSWGTGSVSSSFSDSFKTIIEKGRDGKGVIVLFAIGNESENNQNDESAMDSVIAVGGTDKSSFRVPYSNFGSNLFLMSPGGTSDFGITTIDPSGSKGKSSGDYNEYIRKEVADTPFHGTSASTPIVAGAIALLLEKDPSLTSDEVREKLRLSAVKRSENLPYILDRQGSKSQIPQFQGTVPQNYSSNLSLQLENDSYTSKKYPITYQDRKWSLQVSDIIPIGTYQVKIFQEDDVVGTIKNFTIDSSFDDNGYKPSYRNDFYGYGSLDLGGLLNEK